MSRLSRAAILSLGRSVLCTLVAIAIVTTAAVSAGFAESEWHDSKTRCRSSGADGSASRVEWVFDGDTLRLANGERVRLLGINTPEVDHRGSGAEAGGTAAKAWLEQHVKGRRIRLVDGVESRDRYCRRLAHVFTDSGEHLNVTLVESGLAFVDIHPPNLKYAAELLTAQAKAERAGKGLWGMADYAVQPDTAAAGLPPHHWQRLRGRVTAVESGPFHRRLVFASGFEARIGSRFLRYFPELDRYVGKTVEVRGWIATKRGRTHVNLMHPSALVEH